MVVEKGNGSAEEVEVEQVDQDDAPLLHPANAGTGRTSGRTYVA